MTAEKNKRRYNSVPIGQLLKYSKPTTSTISEKLNQELIMTYNQIKLSPEEIETRIQTFNSLKVIIEKSLGCTVESFGSYRTGMMVYSSDIDITILPKENKEDLDKSFTNSYLAKVQRILENSNLISGQIIHIKKAKTPILKCKDSTYNYKIDISINKQDGIDTAEYVLQQLKERPYLKYFVILLKYFLKRRHLSESMNGGLCSYAQFLLILNFCQLHPLIQNENIKVKENLGVLFLDFFQFYGIDFPYDRAAISVGEVRYKSHRESVPCIEDPICHGNNVGSGCTSLHLVKDVFLYSYKIMTAAISSKVDPRKGVVELWLRLDQKELKERAALVSNLVKQ
jgi:non-canonical poly(A) RNA polymerase PAPD5/7